MALLQSESMHSTRNISMCERYKLALQGLEAL